jgi:hypothetical protein
VWAPGEVGIKSMVVSSSLRAPAALSMRDGVILCLAPRGQITILERGDIEGTEYVSPCVWQSVGVADCGCERCAECFWWSCRTRRPAQPLVPTTPPRW